MKSAVRNVIIDVEINLHEGSTLTQSMDKLNVWSVVKSLKVQMIIKKMHHNNNQAQKNNQTKQHNVNYSICKNDFK